MKKIASLLIAFIVCISSFLLLVSAQDVPGEYIDTERELIYSRYISKENLLEVIFGDDTAIGYWNMVNGTEENSFLKWLIDTSSWIIGEYPDKQDYAEILANLIMMQSGDIAEQIQNQCQYDDLKDGMDYAMDIADIASDFVGGADLLEQISPIIDAATGGANVIIDNVEQAKYYETAIKDYTQSKLFLDAVSSYADNEELRTTASILLSANDKLLERRLEYLMDSSATLVDYQAEFFVKNMSFELLKTADLYRTDETVKWYVDCGDRISKSIQSVFSGAKFAFRMTMLAGDIGFGTSNTFNRYQEMKIVSDIAGAIVEANHHVQTPSLYDSPDALNIIQTKCDYYKMLIVTHARGEYLVYQMLINDAGLLSDFKALFDAFKEPGETTESWYNGQISVMLEYYDILNSIFTIEDENVTTIDMGDLPKDASEFNGHYYYVYDIDTITDWNMAQEYCEAQGGYLATITSPEEDAFLYSYITDAGYSSVMFGLTDQEQTDDWRWVTGEEFSYQNWRSGEPNHQGGYEHYGMYYDRNTDGTWNDGSGRGGPFLCEWGEYTVASGNEPTQEPVRATSDERDIVLVLDVSGSMSGTPMEETKKASMNFIDTILEEDASIGIVTYDDNAEQLANFSVDKDHLTEIISALSDGGGTNIEAGLTEAQSMLDSSSAKKKIIVLMSDGEPNEGKEGEELIAYADQIKNDDILIYTLGFFENMGGNKSSAQYLMEQLASDGCHYEVANADDLVFFFEDMADQINGQKYIYIRIACPVDVSVTYNGETLNSAEENQVLRTDFGTLTFEDSEETSSNQAEEQIKVLRLKEGVDYNVKIVGTGRGIMDYTIGFMDENGDYSDFRRFEDIKITKETVIDTVATVSEESVLNIDEDGDGNYDLKLRADENGFGEEVKQVPWLYIVIGGIIFVLVVVLVVILKVCNKKRRAEIRAISKYCGNCGAKLENSEKVCRHCGRPVDSFLTTASGVIVVGSNRQKKVKRTVRLIAGLIVTVIIATLSVNIASNFTGYYSLLGKILNAYEDDDIDAFVSLSSNVYYYSNENWVENYFENSVGFSLDFFETAVGYRYNLSYEVNEIYVMSERNKDKLIKTLEEAYPEFNTSLIEDVVVADMTVTASQDKKSTSKNIEITMTKEDGEWKILYIE